MTINTTASAITVCVCVCGGGGVKVDIQYARVNVAYQVHVQELTLYLLTESSNEYT